MATRDDQTPGPRRGRRREWLVPAGLILLTAVPVIAGADRVGQLASGGPVTPDNARFFSMPLPVVVHIISASVFCFLGAFQFVPSLRRRRPRWHRLAGRLLVPSGVAAALAGIWMTLFSELPAGDDGLLTVFRLVFGSAMVLSLVLGFVAILRRDVASHQAWMMRGYAIGVGAGTQVLTSLPADLILGRMPEGVLRALLLGAGWAINLAVAEWLLRRRPARRARVATAPAPPTGARRRRPAAPPAGGTGTPTPAAGTRRG
ncbi:MAG: DUF2306 domain-containing protein [Chloroflexi bacterium]|nr:MAG: DUF2306 domain-containing protein [Chloroflexota bacterium]